MGYNLYGQYLYTYLFLEKKEGGGGQRNIDVREEHRRVASITHPDQGMNPQPFGVWRDAPAS